MNKKKYSVTIIGGGMIGLMLAALLAETNMPIAMVESKQPPLTWPEDDLNARVIAMNAASLQLLKNLNLWQKINKKTYSPLRKLKAWDHLGQGAIEFDSADIGEAELGIIIENREVTRVLWQYLNDCPHVDLLCPHVAQALAVESEQAQLTLENNETISAELVVGADGGESWVRHVMAMPVNQQPYHHHAIVAVVKTEKPHQKTAWQNFLPQGPLGLLPLADPYQAAIVWSTLPEQAEELLQQSETAFNDAMTRALDNRLGELALLTEPKVIPLIMRHANEYVAPRVALMGDAAHTIHPLAGQGANLGFMDAAGLAQVLTAAYQEGKDLGQFKILRKYERARKSDNTDMLLAMRGFKELFASQSPAVVQLRSLGLSAVDRLGWLKRCFMQRAM